jgi:acyl-CoA reductase-like NAD-dependent aldehyde dehydrogenase
MSVSTTTPTLAADPLPVPVTALSEGAVDVPREIAAARQAQGEWAIRPLAERLALVRRLRHLVADHADVLAEPIHPGRRLPGETHGAEVLPLADGLRFLERAAPRVLRTRRVGARFRPVWLFGVRSEIRREPFGVVLLIGPGNYPLFLTASQAVQALVAGNAVVIKPGVGAGECLRRFGGLVTEAGFDPRLFRVLPEAPAYAQEAIAVGVDKVLLTGSDRTGAQVLAQLAPRLIPAAMELSGYDASFVLADADLDLVERSYRFAWRMNHGETCIAPHRVFADRAVAAELRRRLKSLADEFLDRPTRGPAAVRAAELVRDAVAQGAEVVAGRFLSDGQGLTPTVIANAPADCPLLTKETFAPVLSLVEVSGAEEALAAAAHCPFALGASIFGNEDRARELAARVNAGSVVVNDVIAPTADPRLPFGGRGHSGFGVTRGAEGLLELTTVKVISVWHGKLHLHLDPPDPSDAAFFRNLIRAGHAPTWRERTAAWWRFARTALRRAMKKPQGPPGNLPAGPAL